MGILSPGNLFRAMTTFSHFSFPLDTILDGVVMKNGEVRGTTCELPPGPPAGNCFCSDRVRAAGGLACAPDPVVPRRPAIDADPAAGRSRRRVSGRLYARRGAAALQRIRHFTFVLPPLAVIAAAGFHSAWRHGAPWPRTRLAAAAGCLLLALTHVVSLARLHPYGTFSTTHSPAACMAASTAGSRTTGRAACAKPWTLNATSPPRAGRIGATLWRYAPSRCKRRRGSPGVDVTRNWRAADSFLSATHMNCDAVVKGKIVREIVRDGVVLAIVRDRRALVGHEREPK